MLVRSVAVWIVLAALALILAGCSAAPVTDTAPTAPPSQTDAPPVTDPPSATDLPSPTELGTDGPLDSDPPPGQLPTPDSQPTPATQTEPPDDADDVSLAGTWVGTIESNGRTQEIRFVLRDLRSRGGDISGTALWENGKIDNGLRGAFEGDTLTLDDSLVNGINLYEGTVDGDVFTGTWRTVLADAPVSTGTFEVTREE